MKKYWLTLLVAITAITLFLPNYYSKYALAQEQIIWIDVRTKAEWNAGHLKQAIHIPYQEISQRIVEVTSNRRQPIYIYCRSGNRSEIATQTLEKMGFVNVQNRGGYKELKRQGQ